MRLGPPLLYVATAGGLALTTRAVLGHRPSLAVALGYLGGYLGLVALGSFVPRLEMWGEVLCSAPGGLGVALTFDDGPHPVHTPAVAAILAARKTKATFFAIGEKVARHPEVIRKLHTDGHEIGIHGHRVDRWLGFRGARAVKDDLSRAVRAVEDATGRRPTLFRPPYGVTNPRIVAAADELDLDVIGWSVRAFDGIARTKADAIASRVARGLGSGAIVCMHDAPEVGDRRPAVLDALPAILDALDARNLRALTVSELLASAPA